MLSEAVFLAALGFDIVSVMMLILNSRRQNKFAPRVGYRISNISS
jgi:hypothetical protein